MTECPYRSPLPHSASQEQQPRRTPPQDAPAAPQPNSLGPGTHQAPAGGDRDPGVGVVPDEPVVVAGRLVPDDPEGGGGESLVTPWVLPRAPGEGGRTPPPPPLHHGVGRQEAAVGAEGHLEERN